MAEIPSCNCTCQIAGAHDPDCAVMGGQQEPPVTLGEITTAATAAVLAKFGPDMMGRFTYMVPRMVRSAIADAAPKIAAAERARCLAEIERFKTIMAGPVGGHLTDAVRIQAIRHVLINGPTTTEREDPS